MRATDFAAIRPYLQTAIEDIDRLLAGMEALEDFEQDLFNLYDLIAAGNTPPEVKGRGKPAQLTEKQQTALAGLNRQVKQNRSRVIFEVVSSKEQAAAIDELPGEPMTDEGREALQVACRGGWRESSRQAAAWLRNAGETIAADGIDVELSRLPDEPRESSETRGYRAAMRKAAGGVKTILTACLVYPNDKSNDAPVGNVGQGDDPDRLSREARAILFVQEQLKTTGKVPPKSAIAKALGVDRRTLNNWSAFKVAYNKLQSENRRQPAKGIKAKDGTLEAWRESGK